LAFVVVRQPPGRAGPASVEGRDLEPGQGARRAGGDSVLERLLAYVT
jgi:hypothetical protein